MTHGGDAADDVFITISEPFGSAATVAPSHVAAGDQCKQDAPVTRSLSTLGTTHSPSPLSTCRRPQWDSLPAEMVSLICEFADAQTLCRLARVDTFTRSVVDRPASWSHAVEKQEYPLYLSSDATSSEFLGVLREDAKRFYATRYQGALSVYTDRVAEHEVSRQIQRQQVRSWWCHCFNNVMLLPVAIWLLIVFLIVLVVQLTQRDSITIAPFVPLFILAGLLASVTCLLCYKRWHVPSEDEAAGGFFAADHYSKSEGCVTNTMESIGSGQNRLAHSSFCGMLLVILLFIVLLSLRVTDRVDWSWWIIFTPLYVVFALCIFGPFLHWDRDEVRHPFITLSTCLFFFFLAAPFLVFTVLLNVRLSGGGDDPLRMIYVLTPLFAFDLLLLIATTMACSSEDNRETKMWLLVVWLVSDGPLIVFKVLLAMRLDGDDGLANTSFALIFLPLYIFMAVILFGAYQATTSMLRHLPSLWSVREGMQYECPWPRPKV